MIVAVEEAVGSTHNGRTVEVSERSDSEEGGRSSGTVAVAERQSGLKLLLWCKTGGDRARPSENGFVPSLEPGRESKSE